MAKRPVRKLTENIRVRLSAHDKQRLIDFKRRSAFHTFRDMLLSVAEIEPTSFLDVRSISVLAQAASSLAAAPTELKRVHAALLVLIAVVGESSLNAGGLPHHHIVADVHRTLAELRGVLASLEKSCAPPRDLIADLIRVIAL